MTPWMFRSLVITAFSSSVLLTLKVTVNWQWASVRSLPKISFMRICMELRVWAISSSIAGRSSAMTSRVVGKVRPSAEAQETLTQRSAVSGCMAARAFGQSRRWMDTP